MHPLEQLTFPTRVAKRAQYEAFEFTLADDSVVVRNGSHPDPSDHEYRVTVDDGLPTACECPADDSYAGACKHRVAVAIRRPILEAVTANETSQSVAADGGRVADRESDDAGSGPTHDGPMDDGEACAECLGEFPCWDCVRTGRKDLPES
ncbi:SWIM zinc finger family protein [Halosimplex rubrum]|uniref:SWIM zinc finger family protein n=1 Tax=Halosimplex rubrum TaxID=869889 RepID=A0A7D5NZY8_9EURY|nr:SWIM zinc finger family protein [Halosimplex rubrum]QLH77237.1 SWIM zinc finger family protein [Halosimplex rubrum]